MKKLDLSSVINPDSSVPSYQVSESKAQKKIPLKKSLAKVNELLGKQKLTEDKVKRMQEEKRLSIEKAINSKIRTSTIKSKQS